MLLRPATPLALIFLVAFILLLLSTLSTPIIRAIPIGSFQGWNLGVFGYCKGDAQCSGIRVGYNTDGLFSGTNADDFELPSSARHSLFSILIIHPIAAALTLVCLGLAIAAHFHGPSHSPRFLLGLLILTIPTLLATLLAFLVDILLFVPHMSWGGWIVLAATVLIISSSVVTCAMRRTLVSRKARKKRIAENADMNGTNYYDNLATHRMMADQLARADSPPPMTGTTATDKTATRFATFDMKRQDTHSQDGGTIGRRSDDQAPLYPTRDYSVTSASGGGSRRGYGPGDDVPLMPLNGRSVGDGNGAYGRGNDDYDANTAPAGVPASNFNHDGSQTSLIANGVYGQGRGRAGYGPPPGRGRGYGPPSRGGYSALPRGGYGPRGGFRGGPPPPGWAARGRGGYGAPNGMSRGRGGMPRPGPPPGYGNIIDQYDAPPPHDPPAPYHHQQPPPVQDEFIAGPVLPIGQAVEMNDQTGQQNPQYGLRDSDADVAGMVSLQQQDQGHHEQRAKPNILQSEGDARSPTSVYSEKNYLPARAEWNKPAANGSVSPVHGNEHSTHSSNLAPSQGVPAPLGLPSNQTLADGPVTNGSNHHRERSKDYYEDVDPRFAMGEGKDAASDVSALPPALTPGGFASAPPTQRMLSSPNHPQPSSNIPSFISNTTADEDNNRTTSSLERQLQNDHSYEQLPDGARSPGAASEASHFTSVSQRGINPQWHPGPGTMGYGGGAPSGASAAQQRNADVILNANPDFTLPGVGLSRGRGGRVLDRPLRGPVSGAVGLTPAGRYPTDIY